MKKILLIVAVVLCVAVAGTALAVTYNSATNATGTLTADTYLALSLDSCSTTALHLTAGEATVYNIVCGVSKSTNAPTADLRITLADASVSNTLEAVTFNLYTDSGCTAPATYTVNNGVYTITGITTDTTYYARFYVANNADTATIGGTMTLSLIETPAV